MTWRELAIEWLLLLRSLVLIILLIYGIIFGTGYETPSPRLCVSALGDDVVAPWCQNELPYRFVSHAFTASWRSAGHEVVCGGDPCATIPHCFLCLLGHVVNDVTEAVEAALVLLLHILYVLAQDVGVHLPRANLDPQAVREFYAPLAHLPRACLAHNHSITQAFIVKRGHHEWPRLLHLGALKRTGWDVHVTWTGDIWVGE